MDSVNIFHSYEAKQQAIYFKEIVWNYVKLPL